MVVRGDGYATGVYPRAGGGTSGGARGRLRHRGLSPRRRGNQWWCAGTVTPPGSIPAQAGEPRSYVRGCTAETVYPRAGGGTQFRYQIRDFGQGLSPRRRGNRGSSADNEIRLFANLCEVSPGLIEELDMADYMRLQRVYEGFLS